ncbi:hypothetical protein YQE_11838, partial [Dendroctonus ponderosae]
MPKKFVGENSKACAAKARKLKSGALEEKSCDQQWADRCKKIEKKLMRKEEKLEKRQQYLNRKNELKELLKKETEVATKPRASQKLTRLKIEQKLLESRPKCKPLATESVAENLNRLSLGEEIARTIDAALALLDNELLLDKQPEKRRKAEYRSFQEKRLKELKSIHPTLKLSQLKELAFKEWQKIIQRVK